MSKYDLFKRIFDVFFSIFLVILLSPVFVLLVVLVYVFLGKPLFFRQKRPGLQAKLFTLVKFRTMAQIYDHENRLLPDGQRMTWFGSLLRRTSLDEIPELFLVLSGKLSFVGPRPLLEEYLPLYSERQRKRHLVKPGLTGWAQINGRNAISWKERLDLDVWYVENRSFKLDMIILLKTVVKVIGGVGVSSQNHVTMEKFRGEDED